ncbi:hypothetical protein AVEN_33127-1, partial [Araneus ventricosus]
MNVSYFFIPGHALKPEASSVIQSLIDQVKKFYVTQIKGYDVHKMCVVTLLMEGTKEDVENLEKRIYNIASKYG